MKRRRLRLKRPSTRAFLALGLASLSVTLLLAATFIGLVPDREALARAHRASLAEAVALSTSALFDEADPAAVRDMLAFLRERNPTLQSVGLRAADGELHLAIGPHRERWSSPAGGDASSDDELVVPVWQRDTRWGRLELAFEPLRPPGWRGHLADPSLQLLAFTFVASLLAYALYLRRMLRHLDPSQAIPARVRAALDNLTEGLLVLDAHGQMMLANRSLAEVLGVAADELIGQSAAEIAWTRRDGAPIEAAGLPWMQALRERQTRRNELIYYTAATGRRATFRANSSPILGVGGRQQGVLVSLQDVTELEEKELALQLAKDEADQANQAKSVFLANMSHEIRTPMNAILGFTEVLRRDVQRNRQDAAQHLDIIHASGRHLLNLINDILDLSKVESGRLEAERLVFEPHRVAQEVVATLAVKAEEKGLALSLEMPAPLPRRLHGDPARLRQILTNLIGNAIKFSERGEVRLRLGHEGLRYRLDVIDSGIGIAADKLETVFEPFVQAESSTARRFGGTGLGLTISRGFARAMGGDIRATSTPGEGATFSVELPLEAAEAADLADPAALQREAQRAAAAPPWRWEFPAAQVLVVDDGAENRALARVVLEEVGLVVSEAENGQVALDRIAQQRYDLVLMDMQMPVLDGLSATRELRRRGCTLPILALTANAMKGFERELDETGFTGHLTKPIDIDALLLDLAGRLGGRRREAVPAALPAPAPEPATAAAAPIVSRLAAQPKFAAIVRRFAEQLPQRLSAMDAALDSGAMDRLRELAHWLKGAGGSVGYDDLYEPALHLEQAAERADAASARGVLDTLHALADRIARAAAPTEVTP